MHRDFWSILSIEQKREVIRQEIHHLLDITNWHVSSDSPLIVEKKMQLIQFRRGLLRLDLTDPDAVAIPEVPTFLSSDLQSTTVDTVQDGALSAAQNIPGWATWPENNALVWYNDHVITPLNASLPVTVNATTNRAVIVALIVIMKDMGIMLWAISRMVIALRNKQWPNLQDNSLLRNK